jgi:paraquat-inducible protein A
MRFALPVLFIAAPVLFAFGIVLPLVTFKKLYFFKEDPSLVGIVSALFDNGDYALALLVALFSIAFPLTKMAAIAAEVLSPPSGEKGWFARLVPFLSKWSMMDVMLVAVVIAAAKTSGLARAFTEPGLWCYGCSALMMSAIQWIVAKKQP